MSLSFSGEVEHALKSGAPVVALESTLISFGLPPERRVEVATALESAVREEGAIPATVAVLDGRMHAGIDRAALERLSSPGVKKASERDLAIALATGGVWATTVAATMSIARRAGIRVFATGGIGGVHRGALETYDESADLVALARHPVLVVCAGPKAVLDLPRTLERLETLGVPVIGYRTSELPAFYHGAGGLPLEARADEVGVLAAIMRARFEVLEEGGILVVQPPPPSAALPPALVTGWIASALSDAARRGIHGNALTPHLLDALKVASSGRTVATNIALVEHNARLAARIARAWAQR